MTNPVSKWAIRFFSLLAVFVAAVVAFTLVMAAGWSPFGLRSETHDTQVIQAIKQTQEVSLLSLGIQGIASKSRIVPSSVTTSRGQVSSVLQYNFSAKLGIHGSKVTVDTKGETHIESRSQSSSSSGTTTPPSRRPSSTAVS